MLCDDQMRALSVFWLDSGLRPASSVAMINKIPVDRLESELAIFKWSKIYQDEYEPVIIDDIKKALVQHPFRGWNKHICMRLLPNGRIECIIAETRYARRFYHAYLPDKNYIDGIFLQPLLISEDDFFRSAGISEREQWASFPVDQQLNLLLDIYDSEAFIPYRRLITKGEEWIKNYTGMEVTPYDDSPQYNTHIQNRPFSPRLIANPSAIVPQKLPVSVLQETHTGMTILQMIEQKTAVWSNPSGEKQHMALSNADIALLKSKINQKDELRLEDLYTNGLDALTQIEKSVFIHIDPFYMKYDLVEGILSNSEVILHEAVDSILKMTLRRTEDRENMTSDERMVERVKFQKMLRVLLDDEETHIQKDLQVTNIRNYLEKYESDITFLEEIWQELLKLSAQVENPFVNEIFFYMDEYGFSREESVSQSDIPANVGSSVIQSAISADTGTKSMPVENRFSDDMISYRAGLLAQLVKEDVNPALLEHLQKTEDEITRLPWKDRPDGYPEHNVDLYWLYWSNRLKTVSDVLTLIMERLSSDELNALCRDVSLS